MIQRVHSLASNSPRIALNNSLQRSFSMAPYEFNSYRDFFSNFLTGLQYINEYSANLIHRLNTMRNFILLPLLSILPLLVLSETSQPYKFSECKSTYPCADSIFNISYPFREPSMPGFPGYNVTCKNNNTDSAMLVLEIDNKGYKVCDINYEHQTIHLVNTDFLGDVCPLHLTNTTFDISRFSYTAHDLNLTLHFNCSLDASPSMLSNQLKSPCRPGSNLHDLYYSLPDDDPELLDELLRICNSNVLIPILNGYKDGLHRERGWIYFWGAIQDGFYLNWTSECTRWCKGCEDTGGVCLRDWESLGKPNCSCNDGSITRDTCNSKAKSKKTPKIIAAVAGVVGAFVLGFCLVLFLYNRRKRQRQASLSNLLSRSSSSKISCKKDLEFNENSYNTHIFTYNELQEATNNFSGSRELGDGGFGTVYKGKLRDGRTVAVKRLYENNYRRLEQFKNEVDILSRLCHQNLVSLYGCTSGRSRELLLVYEHIPNGTLADHLHGTLTSKELLPWPVRMSIAIETAEALAYLHAVERQIIHRDVKTNNILLDNNFHVKVADFGLSRLFPLNATHVSTAPRGTPGYVDPEYHQCYQLTDKSDVYSFGVVLVELISSKPAVDISRHRHEINLAKMAITKIQNGQIDQLVDPKLGYQSDLEITCMINQVAELAFRCLQSDREMRPCIKEVLEVLRGIECGGKKAEKDHAGVNEVDTKEETRLLKNVMPFSPDTVAEQWSSNSTTPNTSA